MAARPRRGVFSRLLGPLGLLVLSLPAMASVVVLSSVLGGLVAGGVPRLGAALIGALLLPLLLWRQLRRRLVRRRPRPVPRARWVVACWNIVLLVVFCVGFATPTARALRRRGDWFLGQRDGALVEGYRSALAALGRSMEALDLPEATRVLLDQPATVASVSATALRPPVAGPAARWFHPLGGQRRVMPPNAACRFGAHRPGRRPRECELGHCGVDLPARVGRTVFAVHDAVVLRVERDEARGGRAGRYVKLSHKDGAVRTWYVHLDEIRQDLRAGDRLRGGERLGTIGLTGVKHSGAHLHFALAVSDGERGTQYRYLDPEPLLWVWKNSAPPRNVPSPQTVAHLQH